MTPYGKLDRTKNKGTYINEIDLYAVMWLAKLMVAGEVSPGTLDKRSIKSVAPQDLNGFRRAHFFAGLGGWDYALRLAGWPSDREVWTGSCPCQPFSAAGKHGGFDDERHLWPAWFLLIDARRPATVFGEQVASLDGLKWLDLVCNDLESIGYTVWASDLPAAGVGAPHIRQRLWWRADRLAVPRREGRGQEREDATGGRIRGAAEGVVKRSSDSGKIDSGMANAGSERRQQDTRGAFSDETANGRAGRVMGKPDSYYQSNSNGKNSRPNAYHSGWANPDWLLCRDNKWRPVEPGSSPLADGVSGSVGRLRAYGNAIVPQLAAVFIQATEEARATLNQG